MRGAQPVEEAVGAGDDAGGAAGPGTTVLAGAGLP
jgi:hypothetical protein